MEGIGGILRDARERNNATFEQIEDATKIKKRYLQALEREEWDQTPDIVYAKGFLRTYARYLGLDEQSLCDLFEISVAGREGQAGAGYGIGSASDGKPSKGKEKKRKREQKEVDLHNKPKIKMIYILCFLSIAVLLFCVWAYQNYHLDESEADRPPTAPIIQPQPPVVVAPLPEPEPEPEPVILTSILLKMEATQACWLRLRNKGELVYENTMRPGDILEFPEMEKIELRLGNAGGVILTLNGLELPLQGSSGQIVTKHFSFLDGVMYDDETGEALS